ncbi:hypothetical protein FKM82_029568 [Ascaphus truei]
MMKTFCVLIQITSTSEDHYGNPWALPIEVMLALCNVTGQREPYLQLSNVASVLEQRSCKMMPLGQSIRYTGHTILSWHTLYTPQPFISLSERCSDYRKRKLKVSQAL